MLVIFLYWCMHDMVRLFKLFFVISVMATVKPLRLIIVFKDDQTVQLPSEKIEKSIEDSLREAHIEKYQIELLTALNMMVLEIRDDSEDTEKQVTKILERNPYVSFSERDSQVYTQKRNP